MGMKYASKPGDSVEVNVITISRQYGAGASELAQMLSNRLGFRVIDKELLNIAAQQSGMDLAKIERVYEQRPSFQDLRVYREQSDKYVQAVHKVLDELAKQGNVIIIGRGANLALLSYRNVFNLRVVADMDVRVRRVMERERVTETEARRKITDADYAREAFYRYLYNVMPDDAAIYDIVLNTSRVTLEEAAAMVVAAFEAVRAARTR
jgi:cytidylate kinase